VREIDEGDAVFSLGCVRIIVLEGMTGGTLCVSQIRNPNSAIERIRFARGKRNFGTSPTESKKNVR
jgi:hypothetical protein